MEIPYTVANRPDTGLYNAKVGIWLFLASEVMLFGGLFSSYVFLRIGAVDYPWPYHELDWKPGFINTMVLILSSVTVVTAWAALKARRYGTYKLMMLITIACAGAFMVIKSYEYNKKFHHYDITMTDGTRISGHPGEVSETSHGDRVAFGEVKALNLNLDWSNADFLAGRRVAKDGKPYAMPEGELRIALPLLEGETAPQEVDLTKEWLKGKRREFLDFRAESARKVTAIEVAKREAKENPEKLGELDEDLKELNTALEKEAIKRHLKENLVVNVVGPPANFLVKEKDLMKYGQAELTYRDRTSLQGKLLADTIIFQPDVIDTRMVKNMDGTVKDPAESAVWKHLPTLKDKFLARQEKVAAEFREKNGGEEMDEQHMADYHRAAYRVQFGKDDRFVTEAEADQWLHDPAKAIAVPRSEKRFYSNFSPSLSPYYAIYFLMTGLHGLHVIGGALVLLYFLLFGRKMYLSNPEHLANRVEVGGLFWHFVDLVWIFLFPLYYLM
jgi:heme/copper-type cytochrome/quinol oxidase subunit 3